MDKCVTGGTQGCLDIRRFIITFKHINRLKNTNISDTEKHLIKFSICRY